MFFSKQTYTLAFSTHIIYHFFISTTSIISDLTSGFDLFSDVHYTDLFLKAVQDHFENAYFFLIPPKITWLNEGGYFYDVFIFIKTSFTIFLYIVNSFQFIMFGDSSELIANIIVLMALQIFSGMNKHLENLSKHLSQSAKLEDKQEESVNLNEQIVQEASKLIN